MDAPPKRRAGASTLFTANIDISSSTNRQYLASNSAHRAIIESTGVEVSTKGRYCPNTENATGADPALHLHIEAPSQECLDRAIAMVERLKTEAPSEESAGSSQAMAAMALNDSSEYGGVNRHYRPGSASGSASGSHSGRLQEKVFVDMESERGFNVRAKLIGTGGENMKYIQNTTGARVQVRGRGSGFGDGSVAVDSNEPMHLYVTARTEEALIQARDYCQSLIDTIRSQYFEFKDGGSRRQDYHSQGSDSRDSRDRQASHYQSQRYESHPNGRSQRPYSRSYSGNQNQPSSGYYDQAAASNYDQQQQQQPYSAAPDAAADPQSAALAGGDAAAYEEYMKYCTQYYQYYGTYPDYSSYYSQTDASAPAQPASVAGSTADAPGGHTYAQPSEATPSSRTAPAPEVAAEINGDYEEGYHNVPPPATYAGNNQQV
ncbi:aconitate hydratase [Kickxella alabastrina]|uniref:Aconitate hydratase n=1 Tax=Kickxella alabastrina TaxID=61397 RepID=A0ACC1I6T1_9FUNG|nr:aconitate hydratase [Kickxella alabastrina]